MGIYWIRGRKQNCHRKNGLNLLQRRNPAGILKFCFRPVLRLRDFLTLLPLDLLPTHRDVLPTTASANFLFVFHDIQVDRASEVQPRHHRAPLLVRGLKFSEFQICQKRAGKTFFLNKKLQRCWSWANWAGRAWAAGAPPPALFCLCGAARDACWGSAPASWCATRPWFWSAGPKTKIVKFLKNCGLSRTIKILQNQKIWKPWSGLAWPHRWASTGWACPSPETHKKSRKFK